MKFRHQIGEFSSFCSNSLCKSFNSCHEGKCTTVCLKPSCISNAQFHFGKCKNLGTIRSCTDISWKNIAEENKIMYAHIARDNQTPEENKKKKEKTKRARKVKKNKESNTSYDQFIICLFFGVLIFFLVLVLVSKNIQSNKILS